MGSATQTMREAKGPALGFDEAFTLHHRAVYRTAYAVVRDAGLAEDVTQEVFLKLYSHGDEASARGEELLRAWLLRVTINVARNTLRGRSRAAAREEEFARDVSAEEASVVGVDADYERRSEIEGARRALERIKEPMRSCLLLKQQGLSYKEIADTLSLNETSVGSFVARGRKEFVRLYGKIGGRR
ncbi:MAG TPA: sigma-70 family RNA polymerase sigma factor [Pyrinomonadaceae bacterium]|nr:sigma-70 family RNA polymerase sigma factor [Pyrinomonadaceae bacterium]